MQDGIPCAHELAYYFKSLRFRGGDIDWITGLVKDRWLSLSVLGSA